MIKQLTSILARTKGIDGWLINDRSVESSELFFVRDKLDMNRSKKVRHARVTVYKHGEQDSKQVIGSASTKVSPAMNEEEITRKIEQAALAASFVENPYYELVKPTDEKLKPLQSTFDMDELSASLPKLVSALYSEDRFDNGKVNSCEFFLERITTNVVNSLGVDESYISYKGQIELVVDWKEQGEEVEITEYIDFSDFDPDQIKHIVAETLEIARLRAIAKPLPKLSDIPVILVRDNVNEFMSYYVHKASAMQVYQKYSSAKVGECFQGSDVKGDKLNLSLLPELKNSVNSRYIDTDGVKLHETPLYKDGVLMGYHGSNRYAQYLDIEPTGAIGNVAIKGGTQALEELKKGPYLEVHYFSDFQMNDWTGDFGGEIRLGIYFDGEKEIPVSGGSISGNIKNVQEKMLFSKEVGIQNNYKCPKAIKLFDVTIAS